jgi:hypothetical protein
MKLTIRLFQLDARKLPGIRGMDKHSFDKIEVKLSFDFPYIKSTVSRSFSSLPVVVVSFVLVKIT